MAGSVDIEGERGCGRTESKYSEAVASSVAPSPGLARALGIACAATLAVVAATPMDSSIRLALAAATALAFAGSVRAVALRRGRSGVVAFRIDLAGAVSVRDATGRERHGRIAQGAFVAPWLTLVRWRPEGAWVDRTFLLVPGMLEPEAFRRLRVLLRWS